jgi:hypothetical protein
MKVKHGVKYLITTIALLLVMANTLSATETTNIREVKSTRAVNDNTTSSKPNKTMPVTTNKTNDYILVLDDAIIFANFDDALPAVVNYYSQASEQEIINFYQQSFGDASSQERKRGRLTLTYQTSELVKRVIISKQNAKRQVDVIVEQVTK